MPVDDIFAVISEPTRRQILVSLKSGDRAVGDLVEELGASQPTVSKHLKVLRDAGLVSMSAQGQRRVYALEAEGLRPAQLWLDELTGSNARNARAAAGRGAGTPGGKTVGAPAVRSGAAVQEPLSASIAAQSQRTSQSTQPAQAQPVAHEATTGTGVARGELSSAGEAPASWAEKGPEVPTAGQQLGRAATRAATKAAEVLANLPKLGRKR